MNNKSVQQILDDIKEIYFELLEEYLDALTRDDLFDENSLNKVRKEWTERFNPYYLL